MTLTQIINASTETISNAEKIEKISAVVAKARAAYGNGEVVIPSPKVNTAEGVVDIKFLTEADKVALAGAEVATIRMRAIEAVEATDGAMLDKEIERLLAVNSTLVNLTAESDSEYI